VAVDLAVGTVFTIFGFCFVAEDEEFEADKAQVVKEIASLEPREPWDTTHERALLYTVIGVFVNCESYSLTAISTMHFQYPRLYFLFNLYPLVSNDPAL
jgi:hypothetical protein